LQIHYNTPLANLTQVFGKINGLLFPGGGMDLRDFDRPYMKSVLHLWNLAKSANDAGDYFPVWGAVLVFRHGFCHQP
jgi:gamma-glutamyl hydrolase